jgi:GNAT superfamily N-acetyltransferase
VTVVVRPGLPTDHERAIEVWAAADSARRGGPAPADVPDTLRERFRAEGTWLLVADDDGTVVGITQGMPAREDDGAGDVIPGRCHLSLVFVLPERWGQGIGTALVEAALVEARARGYDRLQLWTNEDNVRAQALYRRHGLAPSGRVMTDRFGEQSGHWVRDL